MAGFVAQRAADAIHEGGLAGAVRADQAKALALRQIQVDQVQRDECMRSCGLAGMTIMLAAKAMGYDTSPMDGFDFDAVALIPSHLITEDFPTPGYGFPVRFRVEVLGGRVVSSLLHARTDRDKGPWDGSFDRTSRWFSSTTGALIRS